MQKIVLISCVSQKLPIKTRAEELYTSTLFKLNMQFAKRLNPDGIFILSAQYGLLSLDDEVEPYDVTLNNMPAEERKTWAKGVLEQLNNKFDLEDDHFVILAGDRYRQYLIKDLKSFEIPLKGLRIGKQLQYLKRSLNHE